jgi:hypothetical protein
MQQDSNYVGEPLPLFAGPRVNTFSAGFERWNGRFLVNQISGLYS